MALGKTASDTISFLLLRRMGSQGRQVVIREELNEM